MSLTVHTVCFYKRFQPNCREVFFWPLCWSNIASSNQKSDNLQYNTIRRWDDGMIIPPSDGPIIILIDWKYFSETVACWLGLMVYHFVNKDLDFILFPIYQNNIYPIIWTIIPSSHRPPVLYWRFSDFRTNLSYAMRLVFFSIILYDMLNTLLAALDTA